MSLLTELAFKRHPTTKMPRRWRCPKGRAAVSRSTSGLFHKYAFVCIYEIDH